MIFPCVRCGLCCRRVGFTPLDRGDGICRNLDETTNLCRIYETRPDICRVDRLRPPGMDEVSWYNANLSICRQWQAEVGMPEPLRSQLIVSRV